MRKLYFFILEGLRTFQKTFVWNIFSIFFLTIFILSGALIFEGRMIVSNYVNDVGSDVKIEAFLTDYISVDERDSLVAHLETSGEYDSLRLVSKEEALKIFKSSYTSLDIPENLNPLPQSIILYPTTTLIETNQVYSNITRLTESEHIDIVNFNKVLLDKLAGIQKITDVVTLIILILLAFFGIIIYYTSVYHSLNYKYEYLEVVDYFNAPKFWSSFPFYVESILVAVLSTLFFIISYFLFNIHIVDVYFGGVIVLENLWKIVTIQAAVTLFISVLSTFLSLRSYK